MDILAIVNTMQPGTISKLALAREDFPNDESVSAIPFMGAFVQLFPNGVLPNQADVIAYEPIYNALIAQQEADAQTLASLPDLHSQVAQITAAIVASGIALPDEVISAANKKLSAIGQSIINVKRSS